MILEYDTFMAIVEVNAQEDFENLTNQDIFDLHDTYQHACNQYNLNDWNIAHGDKYLRIIECYEGYLPALINTCIQRLRT